MKVWEIDGRNLAPLTIEAETFDDALEIARRFDKGYDGGKCLADYHEAAETVKRMSAEQVGTLIERILAL